MPDDILHAFPLAALRTKNGQYLIRKLAINYEHDRIGLPEFTSGPLVGQGLAIGVSRGFVKDGMDFYELNRAASVVQEVADWFRGRELKVCSLVDEGASKAEGPPAGCGSP